MKFSEYVNEALADNQRYHAGKLVQILPAEKDDRNNKIVKVTDGKKAYEVNIDDLSIRSGGIIVNESADDNISKLNGIVSYLTKNEDKLDKKTEGIFNIAKSMLAAYKKTKSLTKQNELWISKNFADMFE